MLSVDRRGTLTWNGIVQNMMATDNDDDDT